MADKDSNYRPESHIFNDDVFLYKRARSSTPCKRIVPPPPPIKSAPSKSRIFLNPSIRRAQAISFKDNDLSTLSNNYDVTRTESYFQQCFTIEKKIGYGSFGDVFKCLSKDDGKYYAIKKSRERYKGKSDRKRKLQEVAKHEQLPQHPNLVQFYKAWEENGYLYIQTELCECNLNEYLEHNELSEKMVWDFLADLLSAIKHLHDRDLIHLDIKPENIFLTKDGIFKLGDFGLVVSASELDTDVIEGDPKYLAKETMQGVFTKTADIFSLGITTLELACDLELPGRGEGWHRLREGRMPPVFFNKLSPKLQKVILGMIHPNYRLRWTADELLKFPPINRLAWRRSMRTKFRSCCNAVSNFFKSLFLFLFTSLYIYNLVLWLKEKFNKSYTEGPQRPQTPPIAPKYSSLDWNNSFNIDEPFDDSFYLSSTHDDMNASFLTMPINDMSIQNINSYHSPHRTGKAYVGTPVPKMTPIGRKSLINYDRLKANSQILSPSISFNERASFDCNVSEDDDASFATNNFGPKNLYEIFEKMDTDQQNGF